MEMPPNRSRSPEGAAMTNKLREILERFAALPDEAVVPSSVTAIILGVSERVVRYHPMLPRAQVSIGRTRNWGFPSTVDNRSKTFFVHNHVWKAAGMEPWGGCWRE
jgi:hypothetical protein